MKSERLILEKINENNTEKFNTIEFTEPVMRYITGFALSTEQAIERYLKWTDEPYLGNYFVLLKESKKIIGIAKIAEEGEKQIEIGYSLFEAFWGKGFATELAQLLIDFVKTHLKPASIIGFVDANNLASKRVLEKVGLQKIGEEERKVGIISHIYKLQG